MVIATHTCPECGCPDLIIEKKGLVDSSGGSLATAECPICTWEGKLSDTVGMATTEQLWTIERIGDLLLKVTHKHAAGPMIQALEHVGLIPKMLPPKEYSTVGGKQGEKNREDQRKRREHNEVVQKIRDRVARASFAALIEAGFTEAAECHKLYAIHENIPLHPALKERPEQENEDRTFGGDVVDLEDARAAKEEL